MEEMSHKKGVIAGKIRISPHPPNFNKSPAKIMEPKVGASTWAIGNQKCKPYTGNLTAKESTNQTAKIKLKGLLLNNKNIRE